MTSISGADTAKDRSADVVELNPVWEAVRNEAKAILDGDPAMSGFVFGNILNHKSLEEAVVHRICERLHRPEFSADMVRGVFREMQQDDKGWSDMVRADIAAVYDRDPACTRFVEPILYFKGFHAIQTHRLAHWALKQGRKDFALYLQSRSSQIFQTDINPAAPIGRGIFLDHATGFVVGETAEIGSDVSILHSVTLGGTGKVGGDRHPKVRDGVLIGAGAKILGNIEIGQCSRVAAGALVLKPVPEKTTVAGVPARVVGVAGCAQPSRSMDQILEDENHGWTTGEPIK